MDIGSVIAGAERVFNYISGWVNELVIALVILLVGFIVGRLFDRVLHRLFLHIKFDDYCFKLFRRRRRYAHATRRFIVRLTYIIAIVIALARLNADKIVITLVLAILILIFIFSMVLTGMDIIPNLMARWRLRHRKIGVGDNIEVKGPSGMVKGKVEDINFLEVQIKRRNGDLIFIPLSAFVKNRIKKRK